MTEELKDWEHFTLQFDPNPSPKYPHGYWAAYSNLGYDSVGSTPEAALANLIIELSKGYRKNCT